MLQFIQNEQADDPKILKFKTILLQFNAKKPMEKKFILNIKQSAKIKSQLTPVQ